MSRKLTSENNPDMPSDTPNNSTASKPSRRRLVSFVAGGPDESDGRTASSSPGREEVTYTFWP